MNSNLTTVLVGPVIGKVTENSARILVEIDKGISLTLILIEEETENSNLKSLETFSQTVQCFPKFPKIFIFDNLKENTKYSVTIVNPVDYLNPELNQLKSRFRTMTKDINSPTTFKIACVSCNSIKYNDHVDTDGNLWKDLSERIETIDYCIHMGDQVYIDDGKWKGDYDNCNSKCLKKWEEKYKKIFDYVKFIFKKFY